MNLRPKEVQSVIQLSGLERYRYFIKKVADANEVWGLWDDGWAMGVTNTNQSTIPIWPAREYADLCRIGDWNHYVPKAMDLAEFMNDFLPRLIRDNVRVSIFDTPSEASVLIRDDELMADLKEELSKIE
jgi:hypothetical protein